MNCPTCSNEYSKDDRFCEKCGRPVSAPTANDVGALEGKPLRYHGLDALRGIAMLLGIVLHAALPYIPNVQTFWPADENSSHVISTIFQFIHVWRMPLFFILAGFFANLVISKQSWKHWWKNRLLRILLPIIVFTPLMSLTLPWIFRYGRSGEFIFFYSDEGQPFHLWFLWQSMMFVAFTAIFGYPYTLAVKVLDSLNKTRLSLVIDTFQKLKAICSKMLLQARIPITFIIVCSIINLPTDGELTANPIASGLYFIIGYSLYKNPLLFTFLKTQWKYYVLAGLISFVVYIILNITESKNLTSDIYNKDMNNAIEIKSQLSNLLQYLLRIICGVLLSYGFIGFAESQFKSYNPKLKFISDGAYWMYIIHLPIVTLATFVMLKLHIPIEIKFLIATMLTAVICLITYKYLVRSTVIGILLNGKRHPFKLDGL